MNLHSNRRFIAHEIRHSEFQKYLDHYSNTYNKFYRKYYFQYYSQYCARETDFLKAKEKDYLTFYTKEAITDAKRMAEYAARSDAYAKFSNKDYQSLSSEDRQPVAIIAQNQTNLAFHHSQDDQNSTEITNRSSIEIAHERIEAIIDATLQRRKEESEKENELYYQSFVEVYLEECLKYGRKYSWYAGWEKWFYAFWEKNTKEMYNRVYFRLQQHLRKLFPRHVARGL